MHETCVFYMHTCAYEYDLYIHRYFCIHIYIYIYIYIYIVYVLIT